MKQTATPNSSHPDEAENFFRLVSLLLDYGTCALRKLFWKHVSHQASSLDDHLSDKRPKLDGLVQRKVLHQPQMDLLFPPDGAKADMEMFDVTLLTCLLLNTCSALSPQEKAEMDRLRKLRNDVSGHSHKAAVKENDFKYYWTQISSTVITIARFSTDPSFEQEIQDNMTRLKIDPHFVKPSMDVLLQWYKSDQDVLDRIDGIEESRKKAHKKLMDQIKKESANIVRKTNAEISNMDKGLNKRFDEIAQAINKKNVGDPVLDSLLKQTLCAINASKEHGFVKTQQFDDARQRIMKSGYVVLTGKPGEGKTSAAIHLMTSVANPDRCLVLDSASEFRHVDIDLIDIVLIDDIFGIYKLDEGRFTEWMTTLAKVEACVESGKLKAIIASRSEVLKDTESKLSKCVFFRDRLELSSERLTREEKRQILCKTLKLSKKSLSDKELELCLDKFIPGVGFPYCCKLFCSDESLFSLKSVFFEKPYAFFTQAIGNLSTENFLALVCLFCNGGSLDLAAFEGDMRKQEVTKILGRTIDSIGENMTIPSVSRISDCLDKMSNVYVSNVGTEYVFSHNVVYETIGFLYGKSNMEDTIRLCNIDFLCQCMDPEAENTASGILYVRPGSCYKALASRLIHEVIDHKIVTRIAYHPAFLYEPFAEKFMDLLESENLTSTFLESMEPSGYESSFFCTLAKIKSPDIMYIFERLLGKLECNHKIVQDEIAYGGDCFMCDEKQQALENACECGNNEIFLMMCENGVFLSKSALAKSVSGGCVDIAEEIIRTRKRSGKWTSDDYSSKRLSDISYETGNLRMVQLLESQGIGATSQSLVLAVQSKCLPIVQYAIKQLKESGKWLPDTSDPQLAIESAYRLKERGIADLLEAERVPVSPLCLRMSIEVEDLSKVDSIVRNMKQSKNWHPGGLEAELSLEKAYQIHDEEKLNLLQSAGIKPTPTCLQYAVQYWEVEFLEKTINALKDAQSWNPDSSDFEAALVTAYELKDREKKAILEASGIRPLNLSLLYAIKCGDVQLAQRALDNLKKTDRWAQKSDRERAVLVENAYSKYKSDILNLLEDNGIPATTFCVYISAKNGNTAALNRAIHKLVEAGKWEPSQRTSIKEALEEAYKSGCLESVEALLDANVPMSPRCLHMSIMSSNKAIVRHAVRQLKESDMFDPEHEEFALAVKKSYELKNVALQNVLKDAGVVVTPRCLYLSILSSDVTVVTKLISELKCNGTWNPNDYYISRALVRAYENDRTKAEMLKTAGATITPACLRLAVMTSNNALVKFVIQELKHSDQWDPQNGQIVEAFRTAQIGLCEASMLSILNDAGVRPQVSKKKRSKLKAIPNKCKIS